MTKSKLSILFSFFFLIIFVYMAWASTGYNPLAKYFPLFLSILGAVLAFVSVVKDFKEAKVMNTNIEEKQDNKSQEQAWDIPITHDFKVAAKNFLWVLFYFVLIMIIGFILATIIFLVAFLKIRTDFNWIKIILSIGITIGLLFLLAEIMYLKWPSGMLDIL